MYSVLNNPSASDNFFYLQYLFVGNMTKMKLHGERFAAILEALQINQITFCKKAGIQQSYLSNILSGKKTISGGLIESMMYAFPQVNVNRIFTGLGPVLLSDLEQYDQVGEPSMSYKTADPLAQTRYFLVCALREIDIAIAKNCQQDE